MFFADLRDYLAYQLGTYLGLLALYFLLSRVARAVFFRNERGRVLAIGPILLAYAGYATLQGSILEREGTPAWLSTYLVHLLPAATMAWIDLALHRRRERRATTSA